MKFLKKFLTTMDEWMKTLFCWNVISCNLLLQNKGKENNERRDERRWARVKSYPKAEPLNPVRTHTPNVLEIITVGPSLWWLRCLVF